MRRERCCSFVSFPVVVCWLLIELSVQVDLLGIERGIAHKNKMSKTLNVSLHFLLNF